MRHQSTLARIKDVCSARIPTQPLLAADVDHPGPLRSRVSLVGQSYAGTQSRGILLIENGVATEVVSKPRSFFINALETDAVWEPVGRARVRATRRAGCPDSGELLKLHQGQRGHWPGNGYRARRS